MWIWSLLKIFQGLPYSPQEKAHPALHAFKPFPVGLKTISASPLASHPPSSRHTNHTFIQGHLSCLMSPHLYKHCCSVCTKTFMYKQRLKIRGSTHTARPPVHTQETVSKTRSLLRVYKHHPFKTQQRCLFCLQKYLKMPLQEEWHGRVSPSLPQWPN